MTRASVTQHQRASTPETREDRARQLVTEHAQAIAESAAGAVYRVPGSKGTGYVVSLSRETCECRDFDPAADRCERLTAALIVQAKSRTCADCGQRFLGRHLYEVGDDHLTWFEGDELCCSCAITWGVL